MPQFLILADDYKDSEALSRRLTVRPAHLSRMKIEKAKSVFIIGGAKLNDQNNMVGSMLIVDLADEAAVENWVAVDPYMTSKVWDTVTITLFKIAEV